MEIIKFLNKAACSKAAKKLRTAAGFGGIEDTATGKVLVPAKTCNEAADDLEKAASTGGEYFSNIIRSEFYPGNEQQLIAKYL